MDNRPAPDDHQQAMSKANLINKESKKNKVYSSKVVFVWIALSLSAMVGFMYICKQMGVLNPRQNWNEEFSHLVEKIKTFFPDTAD